MATDQVKKDLMKEIYEFEPPETDTLEAATMRSEIGKSESV